MGPTHIYNGFRLIAICARLEDGLFRSQVAIVALDEGSPYAQTFVDFEACVSLLQAQHLAIEGGKLWVDAQNKPAKTRYPSEFAGLS